MFWVIDKTKQIGQFTTDSDAFNFVLKLKSSSSLSIYDLWYFSDKTLTISKNLYRLLKHAKELMPTKSACH